MNIGLVGCGRWGRNILRDLIAQGCSVEVVDPAADARAQAVAAGATRAVADFGSASGNAVGYIVAAGTVFHHECVLACLATGRPVFCEKPLAPNLAAAEDLVRRGAGRIFVMDKWRYHPGIERLGELHRTGSFGAPLLLSTRRLQWGMPHNDVDTSWILLPHELTIALEIMGEIPQLEHASGIVENGRIHEVSASLVAGPVRVNIAVSSLSPAYDRYVRLVCENGAAWLGDPTDDFITVIRRGSDTGPERVSVPTEMPLRREIAAFLSFLDGGPAPRSSVAEGLAVVRRITEIRAALKCAA